VPLTISDPRRGTVKKLTHSPIDPPLINQKGTQDG